MNEKKVLWAPWRMKYLDGGDEDGCVFCRKSASGDDRAAYIIHRGKKVFALLNIYPYNNGHTMVTPYQHTGDICSLPSETYREMMDLAREVARRMKEKMNPQGFNIGINAGSAAGAGIHEHLHVHIVPRWHGDTNFMPVISGDTVISESLDAVYEKLKF